MNQSPKTTADTDPNTIPNQPPENGAVAAHALVPEMRKQWSKFTDGDLAEVKGQDDLTAKVETKYAISHDEAKKQVEAWAQGRQF